MQNYVKKKSMIDGIEGSGLVEKSTDTNFVIITKQFRPVSDLPSVSKLLENIVLPHLLFHIKQYNLWHVFQSAYRPVFNDLLTASDSDQI